MKEESYCQHQGSSSSSSQAPVDDYEVGFTEVRSKKKKPVGKKYASPHLKDSYIGPKAPIVRRSDSPGKGRSKSPYRFGENSARFLIPSQQ